jgi:hypothetical protein
MTRTGIAIMATFGAAGLANAADLVIENASPPPAPNCWASLWDFLNASAQECPRSYAGFTVYATIDIGVGYETNGASYNASYPAGVAYLIAKQSYGSKWLLSSNPIGQSQAEVSMSQPLGADWTLIGALEFGFDPYSLRLANGPRSLVENNGLPLASQSASGDSSRRGQFDSSQGLLGLHHGAFGTLKVGRVNSLTVRRGQRLRPDERRLCVPDAGRFERLRGFGLTEPAATPWSNIAGIIRTFASLDLAGGSGKRLAARRPCGHAPHLRRARLLGQFLGDAVDALPPVDFIHDVGGGNAAFGPDDREMVENVGALQDHRLAVHLHRVKPDLDRLLGQLLGHFLHPVAEQLGGSGNRRVSVPGLQHGGEQPVERISHVFELSLNKSHNDEQAFPHYDKKPTEINFFA